MSGSGHKHTNRLKDELSPYLLQHAHNPVDWYPWGPEALALAREQDRLIFLSVGYATCHWCHVMERESFEDDETAAIMNKHFINIKVDREERPDVDRVYMMYVQAISGSGGWPMSVFLTPELVPVFGGTYYPNRDHYGMPSFQTVLRRLAHLWSTKKDQLRTQSAQDLQAIKDMMMPRDNIAVREVPQEKLRDAVESCSQQLSRRFDPVLGGFSGAPKFPRPCELNLLMMAVLMKQREGEMLEEAVKKLQHMVLYSLKRMAAGGMYDHIGGGFHRYSVDEHWHVPHFEKMLYDNPQLVVTYLMGYQLTRDPLLPGVVRGVLDYLRRDMTHPQGGIYSAEDADSLDVGTGKKGEGTFYVWSADEVHEVLRDEGEEVVAMFKEMYMIKEEGNCTLSARSDPHKEFVGKNVLMKVKEAADLAAKYGMEGEEAERKMAKCRQLLHARRSHRPRPFLDDKIVTAWNGLAISAFSLACRVVPSAGPPVALFPVEGVPEGEYMDAAKKIAHFVREYLYDDKEGKLLRAFRDGRSSVEGFADDYALLISGLLDLYECGGGLEWLEWAQQLQQKMDELFFDPQGGGYYQTGALDTSLVMRLKEDYDGAEPAASSYGAANLLRLSAILPQSDEAVSWTEHCDKTLAFFSDKFKEAALAVPQAACSAYLRLQQPLRQVILAVGPHPRPQGAHSLHEALLEAVHQPLVPDKAVILVDLGSDQQVQFWQQHNPEAMAMAKRHFDQHPKAPPTVFICQNFTCQAPTSDPIKVVELLKARTWQQPVMTQVTLT